MPSGGNNYDKYRDRARLSGRLALENVAQENALHFLAEGNAKTSIPVIMEGAISVEEIDALLATSIGQKRLAFIQQQKDRDAYQPQSPDECLRFVKDRLVDLSKSGDGDGVKINALKALASVAIEERKTQTAAPLTATNAALTKLMGDNGRNQSQ